MSAPLFPTNYRPDIDGLRAIAVLSVVLFHAGVPHFSGGYVGVDVFFVISGYLITAHILASLYQGRFSFLDFYARRARRLFPVLVATVIFTLVFGSFLLMPAELAETGRAAQSVAYFFSNHYFLSLASDYWGSKFTERTAAATHLVAGDRRAVLLAFAVFNASGVHGIEDSWT